MESWHSHNLQYFLSTLSPQQAPLSQLHPTLLLSSSQNESIAYHGDPQPTVEEVVVVFFVVVVVEPPALGSRHLHSEHSASHLGFSMEFGGQQSPSSQLHPALLFTSSHHPSPFSSGIPQELGGDVVVPPRKVRLLYNEFKILRPRTCGSK